MQRLTSRLSFTRFCVLFLSILFSLLALELWNEMFTVQLSNESRIVNTRYSAANLKELDLFIYFAKEKDLLFYFIAAFRFSMIPGSGFLLIHFLEHFVHLIVLATVLVLNGGYMTLALNAWSGASSAGWSRDHRPTRRRSWQRHCMRLWRRWGSRRTFSLAGATATWVAIPNRRLPAFLSSVSQGN